MRRRGVLRSIGASIVLLSTGSGLVAADTRTQREAAKDHVADKYGADKENLIIINESLASWSLLDEQYYQPKVYDEDNKVSYRFLLDGKGSIVDRKNLHEREESMYIEKYGKFSPELSKEFKNSAPDDEFFVKVKISYAQVDWRRVEDQAKQNASNSGEGLDNLRQELSKRRKEAIRNVTSNLADKWKEYSSVSLTTTGEGTFSVFLTANKTDLEKISSQEPVWRITKTGTLEGEDDLNDSQDTHQILDQNDQGQKYDCSGIPIGILEDDHPEDGAEVNYGGRRWETNESGQHVTVVTECAASTDGLFPGAGRFADVYSSDGMDNAPDWDSIMRFMEENNVAGMSASRSLNQDSGRTYNDADEAYDEQSFNRNLSLIKSAGNGSDEPVTSPGKSFNSIVVGNIDNARTGDYSDDTIYRTSSYMSPDSRNADPTRDVNPYPHNKPEVAAVGTNVNTPYNTYDPSENVPASSIGEPSGTSYSAPQVAGLLAILEKNSSIALHNAPDVAKAVVMASATHDVEEGAFNRRGAGCINADKAVRLMENGQYIEDTFIEGNSAQDYYINLNAGDTLQFALCWQSNARMADWSSPSDAQADINLNLYFYNPDGNLLRGESAYDRAYQFMDASSDDVTVDQTGTYQLKVWNSRWDADSGYRNFAIAWQTK